MATKKAAKKKSTSAKKSSAKKSSGRKSTSKKASSPSRRKYSPSTGEDVKREMHEFKRGKLKSGRSGKTVKSRKQAIAIGLSEARREGKKVPAKKRAIAPLRYARMRKAAPRPELDAALSGRFRERAERYCAISNFTDTSTWETSGPATNLHLRTASSAARLRVLLPLMALASVTLPSGSTVASTVTSPVIFMRFASSG